MKKIFISTAILLFLSISCTNLDDEIFDNIPADKYPENDIQAKLMVVPTYGVLQYMLDDGNTNDGGCWWYAQEVTSDEMTAPTRKTDWDDGGKWRVLHQHTWDNNTQAVNRMWALFYRGVVEANDVIEYLMPGVDNPDVAAAIAQMKTMRAYYYYLLIDNYGDIPYVTSFADAPDMPVKETRLNIYNSLIEDLEENLPLIPIAASKTTVGKGMAFSLLAKLYLNAEVYSGTAQWAKAEAYCDSVIALGIYSLESDVLAPFVTANENSSENIFTIPYDEDNFQNFNIHMRTLHYTSQLTYDMKIKPWNGFAAMEAHYNTYEDIDSRKKYFLVGQQYDINGIELHDDGAGGELLIFNPHIPALLMDASFTDVEVRMSGARVVKFEVKRGASIHLSNDFPIFRYADILLMKAEAMIRQGKDGDSYVNEIRERAEISNLSGVNLDMLLEERGREMFWEGHRRQDLIRFGEYNKAWWEKDATLPDRNVFPIPQWAIDANPNLGN